jgi:cytochrome c553
MNSLRIAAVIVLLIVNGPGAGASALAAGAPAGSVERGEVLVTTGGGGRTVRCALCHGDDLRGLGRVPAIAGRPPGYLVRQLSDMQKGLRRGLRADLMSATVARLTDWDMIAIAAYVASRRP